MSGGQASPGAPGPGVTGTRRSARAYALQILYALDGKSDGTDPGQAIAEWGDAFELAVDDGARAFAQELVDRAVAESARVDELITAASRNWRLERMSRVDRNILRLGAAELLPGGAVTPVRVIINEAIELAKRYGTAESAAFVNGILDRVATAVGRTPES